MNSKIKKYIITLLIASFATFSLLLALGLFKNALGTSELMGVFSDAFFVTGIVLISVFMLTFVATRGTFDGISYVGKMALRGFVPGMRNGEYERFADYKVKKMKNRTEAKEYLFLLVVGLGFALVGVLFTVLFYAV